MKGRLHSGEQIVGIASVLLLVVMFLGWYEPTDLFGDTGVSFSAWEAFSVNDVILLLTIVSGVVLVGLTLTQRTAALPVTAAVFVTALGFLSTLLMLWRVLIDQPGLGAGVPDAALDNTVWAWVGLACCVAILYGGYRTMRDESPRGVSAGG
jgi:hypothetical protein